MKRESYMVRVDKFNKWTPCEYRSVDADELDKILEEYGKRVMSICSNGQMGAMAMWACFKSRINGGCYSDIINAYRLLTDDSKSLVDREHELRHVWQEYEELWRIRYFGSVEEYHLQKAKEAKEEFQKRMEKKSE